MREINRVIVIVLDGVGAGEAPDAEAYGDGGSNSLGNVSRAIGGLNTPNMHELGLGNITSIQGVPENSNARGAFGRFQPKSAGKDTIIGHWEMMGVHLPVAFPTYPNDFRFRLVEIIICHNDSFIVIFTDTCDIYRIGYSVFIDSCQNNRSGSFFPCPVNFIR